MKKLIIRGSSLYRLLVVVNVAVVLILFFIKKIGFLFTMQNCGYFILGLLYVNFTTVVCYNFNLKIKEC